MNSADVLTAARNTAQPKPGLQRVFISDVYETLSPWMTGDEFKSLLVQMHRAGELRLTRCDLVGAFDAQKVADSSTKYQTAEWHFIAV